MKFYKLVLILALLVINLSGKSQELDSRFEINPIAIDQEATSIWRTINDISFFEKQGYSINLPEDELIDSLIVKSKNGTFGNEDYASIHNLLETKVFNKENYSEATKKVNEQSELLNLLINQIDSKKEEWNWKFKTFSKYKIIFTLYGTGGSYDPDKGTITLLTNQDGGFMNYQNPANTIIHEITHMGIEYSIVKKYSLSHGNKERIVDLLVYLLFKEHLPDYRIQNMGDTKLDSHLKKPKDLNSLDSIISKFVN